MKFHEYPKDGSVADTGSQVEVRTDVLTMDGYRCLHTGCSFVLNKERTRIDNT
jgi:hypothetical protein